uniref:Uncharacterized protein n=1 Tax=Echinococcus granulosus TaxID=6210 RepID=A0A068WXY7_ECHGR|nr:hypothetical protein EgrG_000405400 [Echinococcus granulosus]
MGSRRQGACLGGDGMCDKSITLTAEVKN